MIVCDTGPLAAAAISNDDHHGECVDLLTSLHLARRKILVPALLPPRWAACSPATAGQERRPSSSSRCRRYVLPPSTSVLRTTRRAGELVNAYRDLGLSTTDGTVFALCERLELAEVPTIDRRHFTIVRPRHDEARSFLPNDRRDRLLVDLLDIRA
jgi:predicted nucleic acid-binding protein